MQQSTMHDSRPELFVHSVSCTVIQPAAYVRIRSECELVRVVKGCEHRQLAATVLSVLGDEY